MRGSGKSDGGQRQKIILACIELFALLIVFWVAWSARVDLPIVPISDPDSWGYLHPSLAFFSDRGFLQTNGRDWLYPTLVAGFIKTTGTLAGILTWQKSLGFLAAGLMALTWRLWVSLLPFNYWQKLPIILAGFLPVYIQQINPQNLLFELQIRPEAVLNFFVYAQLACILAYCRYRWFAPRVWPAVVFGGLAVLFAFATLSLKPSWLFAALATISPVGFGVFGARLPLWSRFATPILGIFLTVSLIFLPEKLFYIKDSASRTFMPGTLFTIHADLIEKDMVRKIEDLPESDPHRKEIQPILAELHKEMQVARTVKHGYETLGFDPDYLFYHCPFNGFLWTQTGSDAESYRSFCLLVYKDAALHNPMGFGRKIFGQFTHFLFPEYSTFYRPRIELKKLYRTTLISYDVSLIADYPPEVRGLIDGYLKDVAREAEVAQKLERNSFARGLGRWLTAWALPIELLFLAAFLACLSISSLYGLRLAGWGALVVFSAPAANAFTVSVAHALDLARYRYSFGGVFLFALTAMAVYLAVVVFKILVTSLAARSPSLLRRAG